MYKSFFLLILSLFLTSFACNTGKNTNMNINNSDYNFKMAWEKVDSLKNKGLYKSALKIIEEIYTEADKSNLGGQKIKALFYKGKFTNYVEEDNLESFEKILRKEIEKSKFPDKQIFQSILAEFYEKFLNANSWYFTGRTAIEDNKSTDIQTWTTAKFIEESNKLYNLSIDNPQLAHVPYTKYKEIFTEAKHTEKMRDNLYEILAYRALNHFKNDRNYLPKTTQSFKVNNPNYFDIPAKFISIKLKSSDINDPKYKTLSLFQKIEKHNLESKDYEELLDVTLMRLDFVKSQYLKQDKEKLYLRTLDKLIEKYPNQKGTAEVYYKKAQSYVNQGKQQYDPNDQKSKWIFKEARDLCIMVEDKYKETGGSMLCSRLRNEIERKHLKINTEKVNIPNENILVNIEFKNIDKIYFKLIKLNETQYSKFKEIDNNHLEYLKKLDIYKNWQVALPNDGDYRRHRVETGISALEKGIYILLSSNNPKFKQENGAVSYQIMHISNFAYWTRTDKSGNYIFIVDRKTGKAIQNATVELKYTEWDREYRKRNIKTYLTENTNSQGYVKFKTNNHLNSFSVKITKGNETLQIDENIYTNRVHPERESKKIMFFTDRAIYRPGQTVYYKGIYINKNNEGISSIVKNKRGLEIQFNDANYQKISETTVSTNEYGSFNGSFVIPVSGLTGNMFIKELTTSSTVYFKVEEYKRPKFEVTFDDYKENYKLGDKIILTGLASTFSGFPLQGAKVVYTVKRKVYYPYYYGYFFRRPVPHGSDIEIAHGETTSDDKGNFSIPVELFTGDIDLENYLPTFNFQVKVDVVDMTGETHSANKTIKAGVTEVNIKMHPDALTHIDNPVKLSIYALNHSGQKVDAKGKITIYKLDSPQKIFRRRYWSKPDTFLLNRQEFNIKFPSYAYKNEDKKQYWKILKTVKTIDFDTKLSDEYKINLPVGEYKFVLNFNDPGGKEIKIEKYTSVYSDENNPSQVLLLTNLDKKEYHPTTSANILWQSDVKGLNIYYSLWRRNYDVLGKNWINLNNSENKTIKILDEHRGGIIIGNAYLYDNRFYQDSKTIIIPWSNKELEFEYTSFRSKLYPGQDEEWRFKIKGEKSDKVMGEILAGMYDASLDKIYQMNWPESIYYPGANYINPHSYGFGISYPRSFYSKSWRYHGIDNYNKIYRRLNWFGFNIRSRFGGGEMLDHVVVRSAALKMSKGKAIDGMEAPAAPEANMADESVVYEEQFESKEIAMTSDKEKKDDTKEIQLRTNLNETVFFYPDIVTDKNGDFIIKFKMNDALTKWKLRMFAHTNDLKFGYDEKEIITQKELMITPNNPRFVREGDELNFKARIDNLTENDLSGNAWIEIFDAESMKPLETIFLKGQKTNNFSMNAKGSALVSWKMKFPKNVSNLLIYRFYAKSGNFSDAEEGILPVLTNQKLVTESMPIWVSGNKTKSFTFKSLKNSEGKDLKNISFTVEATSHPIWLAIQSLPYLKDISCENSISITNALFSNLLAKKITDDNPKIKRVFDKWRNGKSTIDKEALLSNLSKNQELKNILLEETPWILDAINEEEQKRNIALLFDLNQVRNDKNRFIEKIKGLQNSDGGFPWFHKGRSSRYITQYIIETFGKMKHLGMMKNERELNNIIKKAIKYVNIDVIKNYKKLLELAAEGDIKLDDNHLGSLMIHYMYAIQFFPEIKKDNKLQEAYNYYFGQAKKYWLNRPLYLKGMLALLLYRDNEADIALEILKAADEQSIFNEELGRYWKSYHGYYWWQLPIETQALMIEAFSEIRNDKTIVDQLKVWLLKNKQTNSWETDKSTVSAIYSLLFDDGGTIHETKLAKIYIAGNDITNNISNNDIQAGTGYYKKKWSGSEIKPAMAEIKIENPNKDIAWGAVYWQYLQDLDKIETFEETPLQIQRTLYLVKNTDKGEQMTEIMPNDILNPGDLIKVKIRLQVDREMEFIHLSDQRAATFEPLEQISSYRWKGGLGYYQNPRDTKMNFFIDFLPRGVFVLEYPLRVTQTGTFSNGIAELQSYYAPEFSSHSEGLKVKVK